MESWYRLSRAIGPAVDRLGLRPPVSAKALEAAEQEIGRPLPSEYRAWLQIADGQEPDSLSILPNGSWFISLDRLVEQYQHERRFDLPDAEVAGITMTMDRERIRYFVFHPQRVTIAGARFLDYDNFLIDGIPGPAGTVDQVIVFVTECDFVVVAPSLSTYFDRVAELVETARLSPQPDPDLDGESLRAAEAGVWTWLVRGDKPYRSRIKPPRKQARKPAAKKPSAKKPAAKKPAAKKPAKR
jgi:cell wall assembly regulator SMI1